MKITLLENETQNRIDATILDLAKFSGKLPSLTDGWRFNFKKHARNPIYKTYVLVCDEQVEEAQGCLIFELKNKIEPFMAYIEIAPHNIGKNRQYQSVAGCLIAYACRLSFILGKGIYKGWLTFSVQEEDPEDQLRLMAHYSKKYGAMRMGNSQTMLIDPDQGEQLIDNYLN